MKKGIRKRKKKKKKNKLTKSRNNHNLRPSSDKRPKGLGKRQIPTHEHADPADGRIDDRVPRRSGGRRRRGREEPALVGPQVPLDVGA